MKFKFGRHKMICWEGIRWCFSLKKGEALMRVEVLISKANSRGETPATSGALMVEMWNLHCLS